MLSRRSLFSLFVGTAAIAAGAKVHAVPEWKPALDARTRPEHYTAPERQRFDIMSDELSSHTHSYTITDPTHAHTYTPVNMRSDGSIRHRQHHQVDFPPRR